jgi:hypothetical protein
MKDLLSREATKTYDNGYKWLELPPVDQDAKNMKLCNTLGIHGGWCTQHESAANEYGSGGNKLHVLIDSEGKPHAQVMENKPAFSELYNDFYDDLDSEGRIKFSKDFKNNTPSEQESMKWFAENHNNEGSRNEAADWLNFGNTRKSSLEQIKPRANGWDSGMVQDQIDKNPNYKEDIQPMLQDFVKSGDWSNVKDLSNTGLVDTTRQLSPDRKAPSKYMTQQDFEEWAKSVKNNKNMAEGGFIRTNFAEGGLIRTNLGVQ